MQDPSYWVPFATLPVKQGILGTSVSMKYNHIYKTLTIMPDSYWVSALDGLIMIIRRTNTSVGVS